MSQNYEEVFTTTLVSVKGKVLSTWADCSLKEEIYDNKLGDINNKSSAASDLTTLPELAFESDARTLVSPRILCGCPFAISISDSLQGVYWPPSDSETECETSPPRLESSTLDVTCSRRSANSQYHVTSTSAPSYVQHAYVPGQGKDFSVYGPDLNPTLSAPAARQLTMNVDQITMDVDASSESRH